MPGNPIEWTDRYMLSDHEQGQGGGQMRQSEVHDFAHDQGVSQISRLARRSYRPERIRFRRSMLGVYVCSLNVAAARAN